MSRSVPDPVNDPIIKPETVNAALVNISGRQRMLSQRAAMFSLMLANSQYSKERKNLKEQLYQIIDLMESSHQSLIYGNPELNLPQQRSKTITAMYFSRPLNIDQRIRAYIAAVRTFLKLPDAQIIPACPLLSIITNEAAEQLLPALDAVVTQYQKESDIAQQLIKQQQQESYEKRCIAAKKAEKAAAQAKETLIALQRAQTQLIQSEKMSSLGQMVAGIAHEINNPVSFIHGNLQHIEQYIHDILKLLELYEKYYPEPANEVQAHAKNLEIEFIKEDSEKTLASMEMGTTRIRDIVLSLRNFSRVDEAEHKAVDLHEGIENTLLLLQHRLKIQSQRPAIQVVKSYGSLPLVKCYAGQLNQVIMNIVSNAIDALEQKFTDNPNAQTGLQIDICTNVNQFHLTISVSDNGAGMSPAVQRRLFDPFFTTKDVGQGTGMGMAISYQLITENHNGTIDCFSTQGVGTTVVIKLPINTAPATKSNI